MKESVKLEKAVPPELFGNSFESLGPGDEVEVWTWQAKVLEKHGIAKRTRIDPIIVKQKIISEERNTYLEKIPENFYFQIAEEIAALKSSGETEKAEGLKSDVLTLLQTRMPKFLNLALSPEESADIPHEEKFLINRLAFVLKSWNQNMERLLETGEEVDRGGIRGTI